MNTHLLVVTEQAKTFSMLVVSGLSFDAKKRVIDVFLEVCSCLTLTSCRISRVNLPRTP